MHWVNRILVAVLVAAAVAFGPEHFEMAAGTEDLVRVERERESLDEGNAQLRDEIRLLEAEIAALKSDPKEIARIAREDLNLVAAGEVVFEVETIVRKAPKKKKKD